MGDQMKAAEKASPAAAPAPAAPAPAAPAKPAPPAKPAAKGKDRRFFLFTWFGLAWTAFTTSAAAATLGTVRFMWPNTTPEPPSTFKAGTPDQFEPGQVVERFKQDFGVWIVRDAEKNELFALSTTCTHLGCTPNWLEGEQKFKCPCHGSGFYKTGINFEGPAPRPLERYRIGLADDGQILVDKSRKFQYELGQWGDPDASIKL